jgi:hypothetical protein
MVLRRIQTEGLQPGPDAIANFEVALECLERADYSGGEDAMIWGEYGFAPRFPRPAEPPPIGKLIERFERLREEFLVGQRGGAAARRLEEWSDGPEG